MKPGLRLQTNETVLLELQPDRKIMIYWLFQRWYLWIACGFMVYLLANMGILNTFHPELLAVMVTVLLILLSGLWVNFVRTWHWYIVTNQRCLVYVGFIFVQKRLIPLNRIVDVDMRQNILERILGLGSVTLNVPSFSINSSGQQKNLTVLSGLPVDQCNQLLETISVK